MIVVGLLSLSSLLDDIFKRVEAVSKRKGVGTGVNSVYAINVSAHSIYFRWQYTAIVVSLMVYYRADEMLAVFVATEYCADSQRIIAA